MKIEAKNLCCGYGKKTVVSDMSFSVESGEALCILGKNGIGKTTLFKTLLGQLPIISGEIIADTKPISSFSVLQLSKIMSYIPQAKDYSYNHSVVDVVLMGKINNMGLFSNPKDEDYEQATEVLRRLNMEEYANKNYAHLSGGEQQMVLLARAIIQNSSFMLMDEPASNLDFHNQKMLIETIRNLKSQNIGIIMISHNPNHAFFCCEKVLMLTKNGDTLFGDTNKLITPNNLFDVFNVKMQVSTMKAESGEEKRTCSMCL